MSGWALDVDTKGDKIAAARLYGLGNRAADASGFFKRAAEILLDAHGDLFRRSPWVPLDPDTVRRKARQAQNPRTLHVTGTLERALSVWGAPGQRLDVHPEELVFGLDRTGPAYYGVFHQKGMGVPRRQVVKATPTTRARVVEALREHLFGRV